MRAVHLDQGRDRAGGRARRFKAKNKGGRGPAWGNTPTVTAADPGHEFAFNRSGPGVGDYTWRYVMEPTDDRHPADRVVRRREAPRTGDDLVTEKWTGSSDRDADLHRGMTTTLARIKAAAERA